MFYIFAKIITMIPILILAPTRVKGYRHWWRRGAGIIVCNHRSILDIFILAGYSPRLICYLAKSELFKIKIFAVVLRWLHAVPVNRGTADITAIKKCISLTSAGKVIGIFPEGTTKNNGVEGRIEVMKQGVALIALKSKAPIIPALIKKKPRLFRFNTLMIGEPFTLDGLYEKRLSSETLEAAANEIFNRINALSE